MDTQQTHQQDNTSLSTLLDAVTDYARLLMSVSPSPVSLMKARDVADAFDHLNQRIGRIQRDETKHDERP